MDIVVLKDHRTSLRPCSQEDVKAVNISITVNTCER